MAFALPRSAPARPGGPVVLHGVSWAQYEGLLAALGDDHPTLRLTYLRGSLEIMTTSPYHEEVKTIVARLLEAWAVDRGVEITGYGGATFRKQAAERGLEPDECYTIDRNLVADEPDVPDLAIEVVHLHHDVDKVAVYAGLGVREVWWWQDPGFVIDQLVGGSYVRTARSALLPSLDLDLLVAFVRPGEPQTALVRAYLTALRAAG